jgi:hypothetical protein
MKVLLAFNQLQYLPIKASEVRSARKQHLTSQARIRCSCGLLALVPSSPSLQTETFH